MKIVFTGGGTGGHFYPIIAIAEAIQDETREEHIIAPTLYYLAPNAFDEGALFENSIQYIHIPAGKVRRYFSLKNIADIITTIIGTISAVFALFHIYPDVVMSKGGYGSVPTVLAARFLRIPIIIHESDAKPGRANLLAAKFANKIAVSFASAVPYFPKNTQNKIARTGTPIRKALMRLETEGAQQYLGLESNLPTVLILGGSQGAMRINETVLSTLPELTNFANVIHQTGKANFTNVVAVSKVILGKVSHPERYHPIDYLNQLSMQRAAAIASIIVSRAGANTIAEIGLWKKPAILIPIPESISHDQRTNAYAYAQTGAAVILDEENLTPHIFVSEIRRITSDPEIEKRMCAASDGFTNPDAARTLAKEIISIALSHES